MSFRLFEGRIRTDESIQKLDELMDLSFKNRWNVDFSKAKNEFESTQMICTVLGFFTPEQGESEYENTMNTIDSLCEVSLSSILHWKEEQPK